MTRIVSEVFPITLYDSQVQVICRSQATNTLAWHIPHESVLHPSIEVLHQMVALFGPLFNTQAAVIHSTSWRYDNSLGTDGTLVLTYAAVLPPEDWLREWCADNSIALVRITELSAVQGDNIRPPTSILEQHALGHALDHLSLLGETDQAIRDRLWPTWEAVLTPRQRQPAGHLPRRL